MKKPKKLAVDGDSLISMKWFLLMHCASPYIYYTIPQKNNGGKTYVSKYQKPKGTTRKGRV
jgi:hypothetical protein